MSRRTLEVRRKLLTCEIGIFSANIMNSEPTKHRFIQRTLSMLLQRWSAVLSLSIGVVDPNRPMGLIGSLLFGPHDAGCAAAVNDNGLTGHETRTVARQEERHLCDVIR